MVKSLPHTCSPNPEYEAALAPRIKQLRSKLSRFWFEQRSRILASLPDVMKQFSILEYEDPASTAAGRSATAIVGLLPDSDPLHPGNGTSKGTTLRKWLWKETTSPITRGIDDLFDHKSENAKLLKSFKPSLLASVTAGGAQLWKEIGVSKSSPIRVHLCSSVVESDPVLKSDFSLSLAAALEYLGKAEKLISDINQTTWNRLRSELQQGLSAGDSIDDLSSRVSTFFNGQSARADVIALTETNRATNAGRQIGMQQANVERKGWKTSHLENTRATHLENEQLSDAENGIPIDDEWPNGCQYPGDPDAEAAETMNCRCFGYAILSAP